MSDRALPLIIKPQVNISRSTAVRMWLVAAVALLVAAQSSFSDAGSSFGVASAALFAAVFTEFLLTRKRYGLKKIRDGSAAVSGLILALMLPNYIEPVYAAMGAVFAMVVVKHSFGGLGSNFLNPALAGWLFVRFSWPGPFSRALEGAFVPESLPLTGSEVSQQVSGFLNRFVFSIFGADLPSGYIELFSMQSPGIIADRAVLALVLGIITIAAFMITRLWFSVLYLAVFCFFVRILGGLPFGGELNNGNVILALFSGGTLLAAFFLIAEPSSGAKSSAGKAAAVVAAALLGSAFRFFGGELYGAFYAVALVNVCVPLLCRAERRWLYQMSSPEKSEAGKTGGDLAKIDAAKGGGA